MEIDLSQYITHIYSKFPILSQYSNPWQLTASLSEIIETLISELPTKEYHIQKSVAIHHSAQVEENVVLKEHTVIMKDCVVKSGAYLRSGALICEGAQVGANCEIKQSIIFEKSRIAHLNYVGNSIIGEDVNMEAGSVLANHFNERDDKTIHAMIGSKTHKTSTNKFGSLIGDRSRIGANAVLNPGTILAPKSIVGRLCHIDQISQHKK